MGNAHTRAVLGKMLVPCGYRQIGGLGAMDDSPQAGQAKRRVVIEGMSPGDSKLMTLVAEQALEPVLVGMPVAPRGEAHA